MEFETKNKLKICMIEVKGPPGQGIDGFNMTRKDNM